MKKLLGIFFSTALAVTTLISGAQASPASGVSGFGDIQGANIVQVRDHGAVAAGAALGLLGGIAVGSAIANSGPRYVYGSPGYVCDEYDRCYPRRGFRRGLIWDEDCECWVRPRYRYDY